jgi:uncharacterized protein YdeI (YjbR/CyaY-like superfamily)
MRFRTTVELGGRTATGIPVPDDVVDVLAAEDGARSAFDAPAYTHRKERVRWIEEAEKADTRARRVVRTVAGVTGGGP